MATNFVQPGDALRMIAPTGGVVSGQPLRIGSLFGVPAVTAAAGEAFTFHVAGVWRLPKVAADVAAVGAPLHWDATAQRLTVTATGNGAVVAHAVAAAGAGVATVEARLAG